MNINKWDAVYRGSIHLYGHVHKIMEYSDWHREKGWHSINVGVDVNNFYPVNMKQILAKVQ